jgi:hypothetical protein
MKLILKVIGWLFIIIIGLFLLWLSAIFGPTFYISYNNCTDTGKKPIIKNVRIYEELPTKNSKSLRLSDLSEKYNHSFLCIEDNNQDNDCHMYLGYGEYTLKQIYSKEIQLTGRVIKQYSFNAFNSDMYTLEVLIGNKKYLVSHQEYDDMTIKDPIQKYENRFTEPTCSIFK